MNEANRKNKIVLIGIGIAGMGAVSRNVFSFVKTVGISIFNDDHESNPDTFIQIGAGHTIYRLAHPFKPEEMSNATYLYREDIEKAIEGFDLAIIVSDEGGGISVGIAPVVAKICTEAGIKIIGIISLPYSFEGPVRRKCAEAIQEEFSKSCNVVVNMECEKALRLYKKKYQAKLSMEEIFNVEEEFLWKITEALINNVLESETTLNIRKIISDNSLPAEVVKDINTSCYDENGFFSAYMDMPRSKGLSFAGEWHVLKSLIPDVTGKSVLDLGCGLGWHCRYAAEHGTARVLGIDASRNMLERAKEINSADGIEYKLCTIEDFDYPTEAFDLVISNLALHYVDDLESVYKKVYRTLRPDGTFLFNIEHPTFTAGVREEWITDENGKALYWPVDDYYYPGERMTDFLGYEIKKYHHTLTQIIDPLIRVGFTITAVREAEPPEDMMDIPGMKDEMRRPMMLLVRACKK